MNIRAMKPRWINPVNPIDRVLLYSPAIDRRAH
jgi:hypothetical protein